MLNNYVNNNNNMINKTALEKISKDIENKHNEFYKNYFKKSKDTNFMLKVKERLMKQPQTKIILNQMMKTSFGNIKDYIIGTELPEFELCKNIYMINQENMQGLKDDDKSELRESEDYINKVMQQTILQLKLRSFGTVISDKESQISFKPSIYSLKTLITYTHLIYTKYINKLPKKNIEFFNIMFNKINDKSIACIKLVDSNLTEEAFSILRSLVETYMIYILLIDKESTSIDIYTKHVELGLEYNLTNEIPKEFMNKTNKIDYLNFGWLDSIDEYGYITNKKYKLSDVAELIDLRKVKGKRNKLGNDLYKIYKMCNPLSHGSNKVLNPLKAQKLIISNLSFIFNHLATYMKEITLDTYIENEINIFEYFKKCNNIK